ncbi:MAG: dipeptidase [Chthoniobacterales bacterium]
MSKKSPVNEIPQNYLEEFEKYLRFPSISTQKEHTKDLQACAEWLQEKCRSIGLEASIYQTPGHPIVLARHGDDPNKRTVLVYGHYDVQPPDPLDLWVTPAFEPTTRKGKIFARGATDNKGQNFAHLLGTAELLQQNGELPVNIIYLLEGEEEIGSSNLPDFLRKNRDLLKSDIAIISDTGMAAHNYPTLAYGLRGVTALECKVFGPKQDLHSGLYGGTIANPLTAAARLIASLHDETGRVAIKGFYDDVEPLKDWEREAAKTSPIKDQDFIDQTGVNELFGEPGYTAQERVGSRPTAEVNGMGGGYQGEGTKTVLPATAQFKLTFRLVAKQAPEKILDLAEAHLRAHCPPGVRIELTRGHSGPAYMINPMSPDGLAAQRALEKTFGKKTCLLREGGSIPILQEITDTLGIDCLLLALASPDCNVHSPNENFPLENFMNGIQLHKNVLKELATVNPYQGDITPEAIHKNASTC